MQERGDGNIPKKKNNYIKIFMEKRRLSIYKMKKKKKEMANKIKKIIKNKSIADELENIEIPICPICKENPQRQGAKTCSTECSKIHYKECKKEYQKTDKCKEYQKKCLEKNECILDGEDNHCYWAYSNSRVMLDPFWIGGDEKFVDITRIKFVILLRRDSESPPEIKLDAEEAINILEEGRYQVLEGAGTDVGSFKYEPFYNPYLLVRSDERTEMQKRFFRELFNYTSCYIINTGVETVEESQMRIRNIIGRD